MTSAEEGGNQTADESTDKLRECDTFWPSQHCHCKRGSLHSPALEAGLFCMAEASSLDAVPGTTREVAVPSLVPVIGLCCGKKEEETLCKGQKNAQKRPPPPGSVTPERQKVAPSVTV